MFGCFQTSGEAVYVNDIPSKNGELYGAFVISTQVIKAHQNHDTYTFILCYILLKLIMRIALIKTVGVALIKTVCVVSIKTVGVSLIKALVVVSIKTVSVAFDKDCWCILDQDCWRCECSQVCKPVRKSS